MKTATALPGSFDISLKVTAEEETSSLAALCSSTVAATSLKTLSICVKEFFPLFPLTFCENLLISLLNNRSVWEMVNLPPTPPKESAFERICQSALRLFSSRGYHKTTMDDIAAEAGLTKGAIYWHFKNKLELFRFLIESRLKELDELISSALSADAPPPANILNVFSLCLDYYEKNRDFCALIKVFHTEGIVLLDEEFETRLRSTYARYRAMLAEAVRKGIAGSSFAPGIDPEAAGAVLIAAFDGLSFQWLVDPAAFSLRAALPVIRRMVEKGLA